MGIEVTAWTWVVAVAGAAIMIVLGILQFIAVLRPDSAWTIVNVYGGSPDTTDVKAYFAFNQGYALVDAFLWMPLQLVGSVGMLLGERWGYLLALMASVPYWYTAVPLFTWDRDLGFRVPGAGYWVKWAAFPAYGIVSGLYCFARLLA